MFPSIDPSSEQFIQLMAQYSLSHKLTIPDAMIAATALTHNISLYTLNLKDFRFIQGLKIYESSLSP
ncbi:PIN domain-containing protein [Oscillatoria nigro-viridis]|uniref:PIN domain-containing protein n=2 Tax=Oscillatoriales TaxID=1150 RepID=UPI001CC0413D|nr:PIN domain-containing protein [Oscillatoria nigro-viridis]